MNALLVPMTEGTDWFQGALGIDGNQIEYIGPVPSEDQLATYDEVLDLSHRHAILPGFINTHGHASMSLLRGFADDLPLQEWLEEKIWPMEAKFTPRQIRAGTALAVVEMLKSGTTCFVDMYDHMDTVAEVVVESGIRATLCRGVIGLGSESSRQKKLQEAIQFALNWKGAGEGRIQTMLSPHSPYTCSPGFIQQFIDKAAEYQLPLHTHLSETAREVQQNVDEYGLRPVEHLRRLGFFDLPSLVAHAVHVNDEEIEIFAEYGVKVSHNPGSNLKLGSGIAPIPKMLKRGIRPSIGTDSAASNNNLDMLEEIQLTALIHKGVNQDPEAVQAKTALRMGTQYGAESIFRDQEIGTLEVGKRADMIIMDLSGAHMKPMHSLISHIVYSASKSDIKDVYIDGQQVVKDGNCLTLDEEKICAEAEEAFSAIHRK